MPGDFFLLKKFEIEFEISGALHCDPGRHLQECPGAHIPESAPRSAFRVLFRPLARSAP